MVEVPILHVYDPSSNPQHLNECWVGILVHLQFQFSECEDRRYKREIASLTRPTSELWAHLEICCSLNKVDINPEDYRYQLLFLCLHCEFLYMQNKIINKNTIGLEVYV